MLTQTWLDGYYKADDNTDRWLDKQINRWQIQRQGKHSGIQR